jgi:hypothetical protein
MSNQDKALEARLDALEKAAADLSRTVAAALEDMQNKINSNTAKLDGLRRMVEDELSPGGDPEKHLVVSRPEPNGLVLTNAMDESPVFIDPAHVTGLGVGSFPGGPTIERPAPPAVTVIHTTSGAAFSVLDDIWDMAAACGFIREGDRPAPQQQAPTPETVRDAR